MTTDTSLPSAIQKQLDSANALHSSMYSTPESQPGHTEPQAEDMPQEPAKAQVYGEEDAIYWQQRFNVLQGKYNAEVPALQQQVRELKEQLNSAGKAQSGKAAEFADALESDLTDEELDFLGPELTSTIRKLIAKSVPVASEDLTQLKSKVDSFEQEATEHKQALFWSEINRAFPNWQELQNTSEAQRWLSGLDLASGQLRNDLLNSAAKALNAPQVLHIFRQMIAETGGRQIPLDKIQPNSSRAANHQGNGGKLWSRAEINAFYKDKTQGRYTSEQANAIEADIFAAQSQGRIAG